MIFLNPVHAKLIINIFEKSRVIVRENYISSWDVLSNILPPLGTCWFYATRSLTFLVLYFTFEYLLSVSELVHRKGFCKRAHSHMLFFVNNVS